MNITYSNSSQNKNVYLAFKEGTANSEGIAKTFSYLLKRLGIESELLSDNYYEEKKTITTCYYWNTMMFKDEKCNFDASLDSNKTKNHREWFNIGDEIFYKSHKLNKCKI